MKITDSEVSRVSVRVESGERVTHIAREFGMTKRGLLLRLKKAGLSTGHVGRPLLQRLNHCKTCRCKGAPR